MGRNGEGHGNGNGGVLGGWVDMGFVGVCVVGLELDSGKGDIRGFFMAGLARVTVAGNCEVESRGAGCDM
jgi:hypothetical protein